MSISETDLDWSSLLSQISVILLLPLQSIFNSEEPQQDQQELVKHKQQKIWQRHWLFNVWSLTAQTVWIIRLWVVSSVVSLKEVLGPALMSLIVLISKCCLWSLSKFLLFSNQSNVDRYNSSSRLVSSLLTNVSECSLLWIPVMRVELSFPITSRLFSDL